jgi:hypothetical protein
MATGDTVMVDTQGQKWNIPAAQVSAATAKGLKPAGGTPTVPAKPAAAAFTPPSFSASPDVAEYQAPVERLGPDASGIARPLTEAATGFVTGIPDLAYMGGNAVNRMLGIPAATSPGEGIQSLIDKTTTAPTDRTGRIEEFINATLAGSLAGPKLPRVSNASPAIRRLASEGVVTTPGQRAATSGSALGKTGGAIEEKLGAILPPIKNARAKSVEQWNTARLNEALSYAGEKPLKKGLTGHDAIRETYQALQAGYRKALSRAKVDWSKDEGFKKAMQDARGRYLNTKRPEETASAALGPEQTRTLKDIIDNQIVKASSRGGQISGEKLKEIEETLRVEAEHLESGSYQDRQLAGILQSLRSEFKAMVSRQNPEAGEKLERLDRGYANYKTSARAANYSASKGGGYTPGQRLQSIKARDTSKDRNRFATGEAHGQEEAQEAQDVLGNTQPDSGTPFGNTLAAALLGIGGHAVSPGYGALLAAAPAAYSQPVLKWLQQRALSEDPELLSKLGAFAGAQQAPNPLRPQQSGVAQ